jgi:hypothetical protein
LHANSFPILDSADAAVTITAGDPSVYNTTAPKFGAGNLDFNANSRFINTASDPKFTMGTSHWTWEGWIKGPARNANSRAVFSSNFLTLRCNTGGTTLLVLYSFNGSTSVSLTNITIGSGVWTFVSISRTVVGSNSVFRVFVNGIQVGSDVTVAATNMTGVGGLNFGGAVGNQNTSLGALDECRISKVIRDGSVVPTAPFPDGLSTSYSNAGGSGDRTATIPVTASAGLVVNTTTRFVGVGASGTYFANARTSGWLKFDFGTAKIINELKYYQSNAVSQGTWQFEGSNDDSTWTAVGSPFEITGTAFVSGSAISSNTNSYRYYRINKTGAGATSSGAWAYQFEFKISL